MRGYYLQSYVGTDSGRVDLAELFQQQRPRPASPNLVPQNQGA